MPPEISDPGERATELDGDLDSTDDEGELVASLHRLVAGSERLRLDAFIPGAVPELSRAQAQRLIAEGQVSVAGEVTLRGSVRLRSGDEVVVTIPTATPLELVAEDIPLTVVYEDHDLIAVDKPAGMVVHPAPGHYTGTLVHALLFHCQDLSGIGGKLRPGIVHRLDKDTSGVMIASKNDAAHAALVTAFQNKVSMRREYLALAAPSPGRSRGDTFTLQTLHGRHPVDRKRFSSKVSAGKDAITHVTVEQRFVGPELDAALLRCRLETGRTHQIRVHAADHGFALLADPVYGTRPRSDAVATAAAAIGRQALHAALLEIDHPISGKRLRLEAAPPVDFAAALQFLRSC